MTFNKSTNKEGSIYVSENTYVLKIPVEIILQQTIILAEHSPSVTYTV